MKVMTLVAHPKIEEARVHGAWMKALYETRKVTVRSLYEAYPLWRLDVAYEQKVLAAHDRIVLQFPFYLYGCPPLLKKWLDEVLTFRWAYGPGGDALRGKQLLIATSTGGPGESYHPGGYHNFTVEQLLLPFQQIAYLVQADYLKPYVFHRARSVSDAELLASAADYTRYVLDPKVELVPPPQTAAN